VGVRFAVKHPQERYNDGFRWIITREGRIMDTIFALQRGTKLVELMLRQLTEKYYCNSHSKFIIEIQTPILYTITEQNSEKIFRGHFDNQMFEDRISDFSREKYRNKSRF
jgi:hypothetical protein